MTETHGEIKQEIVPLRRKFRRVAGRLQIWRLCPNTKCRRARNCRGDPTLCGARLVDWAEAMEQRAQAEANARDPNRRILIAGLKEKIAALSQTMSQSP